MAIQDLSSQFISQSYQNLMQISSSGQIFNGSGSAVTSVAATASVATRFTVVQNSSGGAGYYPLFTSVTSGNGLPMIDIVGLSYKPTENLLSVGQLYATGGFYASGSYSGSGATAFTDGIVMDYVTGNGRISAGPADSITFYNGGIGNTPILTVSAVSGVSATSFTGSLKGSATLIPTAASTTTAGSIYIDTATNKLYVHNGTSWKTASLG
jgi:hypothetical protein